ncbi:MAG: protein kinase [Planctomycetes bacterium]|nr:protein kinase [Planctomycetota bacterium]
MNFLGRGGMGEVYRAKHATLKIDVAVKVLRRELSENRKYLEKFFREAQEAAKLDHQNIVRVLDADSDRGIHFLVMQYIDGPSLRKVIIKRRKTLPVSKALLAMLQALSGLSYAHRKGLVHRDLKPDNLMFTSDGVLKITDFGLAKQYIGDGAREERHEIFVTPSFMPPEQWESPNVGPSADIYALGITLFWLLSGRYPIKGDNPVEIKKRLLDHNILDLKQAYSRLDDQLCAIVHKAIEFDSYKRYQSASEFAATLKEYLQWRNQNKGTNVEYDDIDYAQTEFQDLMADKDEDTEKVERVSISICPGCNEEFPLEQELIGKKLKCSNCGKIYIAEEVVLLPEKKKSINYERQVIESTRISTDEIIATVDRNEIRAYEHVQKGWILDGEAFVRLYPNSALIWKVQDIIHDRKTEEDDFLIAQKGSVEDCERYLITYSEGGRFYQDVLQFKASKEDILVKAMLDFERVKSGWLEEAENFTMKYPDDEFYFHPFEELRTKTQELIIKRRKEEHALKKAITGDALDCLEYLNKFSEGRYGEKVHKLLEKREKEEGFRASVNNQAKVGAERDAYERALASKALNSTNPQFLRRYLREFPSGQYKEKTAEKLELLLKKSGKTKTVDADENIVLAFPKKPDKKTQLLGTYKTDAGVYSVAFSSDGSFLAFSEGVDIVICEITPEKIYVLNKFQAGKKIIKALAFSPDSKHLFFADKDRSIKHWSLEKNQLVSTLTGHAGEINSLAVSERGSLLLSVSDDKTAKIWDIQRLKQIRTLKKHTGIVFDGVFSTDNRTIATASVDKSIVFWSLKGKVLSEIREHNDVVNSIGYIDENTIVSASDDKTIRLWNTETGQEIRTIAEHTKSVLEIVVTPDSKYILSKSNDGM